MRCELSILAFSRDREVCFGCSWKSSTVANAPLQFDAMIKWMLAGASRLPGATSCAYCSACFRSVCPSLANRVLFIPSDNLQSLHAIWTSPILNSSHFDSRQKIHASAWMGRIGTDTLTHFPHNTIYARPPDNAVRHRQGYWLIKDAATLSTQSFTPF